jgi:hypothetical protein
MNDLFFYGLGIVLILVIVLLFGQLRACRYGPIGYSHRFLTVKIPNCFDYLGITACLNCLQTEKHPLIQIFYLILLTGCIVLFYFSAFSRVSTALSPLHHILIPIAISYTYFAFYLACTSDPGIITEKNVEKVDKLFDYDYIIFKPKTCSTCKFDKPARSKHCRTCNLCIAAHGITPNLTDRSPLRLHKCMCRVQELPIFPTVSYHSIIFFLRHRQC